MRESLEKNQNFSYVVPSRAKAQQVYLKAVNRFALKRKDLTRNFLDKNNEVPLGSQRLRQVLEVILDYFTSGRMILPKRMIFYSNKVLLKNEETVDEVIDDICCMLLCTRASLRIHENVKGVVAGKIKFTASGHKVDCSESSYTLQYGINDNMTHMTSEALFILVLEKRCNLAELLDTSFSEKFPCVMIAGGGQPDITTRLFLRKLSTELNLPVFGLVDCDPYGLQIMNVYKYGSKSMAFDGYHLVTPSMKWLGIRPSDLDVYGIGNVPMLSNDTKVAKELLGDYFDDKNAKWQEELSTMVANEVKSDVQEMGKKYGINHLMDYYLPRKLQEQDWV